MIFPPRTRRIALALAVCALPMVAFADAERRPDAFAGSTAHPWKIALARRLADEGMESRKERERFAKQALREWRRRQRAKLGGEHARPVAPDGSTPRASEPTVLRRLPRRLRRGRLVRLALRRLDPVPPHLVVDARAVDAEALGRLALVAAGQAERLHDRELLHLLEREMRGHQRMLVIGAAVDLLR